VGATPADHRRGDADPEQAEAEPDQTPRSCTGRGQRGRGRSRWTRGRGAHSRWTRGRWTHSRWTRSRWTRSRGTRGRRRRHPILDTHVEAVGQWISRGRERGETNSGNSQDGLSRGPGGIGRVEPGGVKSERALLFLGSVRADLTTQQPADGIVGGIPDELVKRIEDKEQAILDGTFQTPVDETAPAGSIDVSKS